MNLVQVIYDMLNEMNEEQLRHVVNFLMGLLDQEGEELANE